MDTCDFLVIGAGIAGASAAYELANRGRVVLLERESLPGYHSTGRSAAVLEAEAMDMDVHAIHQGFLKGLRRRNGDLVTTAEVTRLIRSSDTWEVHTANERFSTGIVVNAAGAWCDEIGKLVGAKPIGL